MSDTMALERLMDDKAMETLSISYSPVKKDVERVIDLPIEGILSRVYEKVEIDAGIMERVKKTYYSLDETRKEEFKHALLPVLYHAFNIGVEFKNILPPPDSVFSDALEEIVFQFSAVEEEQFQYLKRALYPIISAFDRIGREKHGKKPWRKKLEQDFRGLVRRGLAYKHYLPKKLGGLIEYLAHAPVKRTYMSPSPETISGSSQVKKPHKTPKRRARKNQKPKALNITSTTFSSKLLPISNKGVKMNFGQHVEKLYNTMKEIERQRNEENLGSYVLSTGLFYNALDDVSGDVEIFARSSLKSSLMELLKNSNHPEAGLILENLASIHPNSEQLKKIVKENFAFLYDIFKQEGHKKFDEKDPLLRAYALYVANETDLLRITGKNKEDIQTKVDTLVGSLTDLLDVDFQNRPADIIDRITAHFSEEAKDLARAIYEVDPSLAIVDFVAYNYLSLEPLLEDKGLQRALESTKKAIFPENLPKKGKEKKIEDSLTFFAQYAVGHDRILQFRESLQKPDIQQKMLRVKKAFFDQ